MSTNPFYALVSDEGRYSLWPVLADVPAGWTVAHGSAGKEARLEHVEAHRTDLRPRSLRESCWR